MRTLRKYRLLGIMQLNQSAISDLLIAVALWLRIEYQELKNEREINPFRILSKHISILSSWILDHLATLSTFKPFSICKFSRDFVYKHSIKSIHFRYTAWLINKTSKGIQINNTSRLYHHRKTTNIKANKIIASTELIEVQTPSDY